MAFALDDGAIRHRAEQWHDVLSGATRATIPDGLRLTMPADRAAGVAGLAAAAP